MLFSSSSSQLKSSLKNPPSGVRLSAMVPLLPRVYDSLPEPEAPPQGKNPILDTLFLNGKLYCLMREQYGNRHRVGLSPWDQTEWTLPADGNVFPQELVQVCIQRDAETY